MPKILVVDDNPDLVELFDIVLTRKGHIVTKAGGGSQCLEILKTSIPDLILLDIMMEPMDGWETLKRIKNNARTKPVPVIMLTGKPPTWDEILSHMDDIEDYTIKPVTMEGLTSMVRNFFRDQESIALELAKAESAGADASFLEEYRNLKRSITSGKTMQKIIGHQKDTIDKVLAEKDERLRFLQNKYHVSEPAS
ncbi:MAG: response regulator [Methanoregula sp.]|nr:MAG: response regulator [Methanoregula sp.]